MTTIYTVNNKVLKNSANDKWLIKKAQPILPANTIRVRTSDGNVPIKVSTTLYETATLVPGTNDVYDVYKSGTSLAQLLYGSSNVVEVIGANTTNVTNMNSMFFDCSSLISVPLFDTSNVTTGMENMFTNCTSLRTIPLFDTSSVTIMRGMFMNCTSLTSVPLFDTSKVTNMASMLKSCTNVQSGALALYQQASTQTNPPTNHYQTFSGCGSNTTTGAAELAQIPSDWK